MIFFYRVVKEEKRCLKVNIFITDHRAIKYLTKESLIDGVKYRIKAWSWSEKQLHVAYRDFHGQGEQEEIGTGKALTYGRELRSRAGPTVHRVQGKQHKYKFG